jgi:DNA repair exonuclease SbcCD ATPase subunit
LNAVKAAATPHKAASSVVTAEAEKKLQGEVERLRTLLDGARENIHQKEIELVKVTEQLKAAKEVQKQLHDDLSATKDREALLKQIEKDLREEVAKLQGAEQYRVSTLMTIYEALGFPDFLEYDFAEDWHDIQRAHNRRMYVIRKTCTALVEAAKECIERLKDTQAQLDATLTSYNSLIHENAELVDRLERMVRLEGTLNGLTGPNGVCQRLLKAVSERDKTVNLMEEDINTFQRRIHDDLLPIIDAAGDLLAHNDQLVKDNNRLGNLGFRLKEENEKMQVDLCEAGKVITQLVDDKEKVEVEVLSIKETVEKLVIARGGV